MQRTEDRAQGIGSAYARGGGGINKKIVEELASQQASDRRKQGGFDFRAPGLDEFQKTAARLREGGVVSGGMVDLVQEARGTEWYEPWGEHVSPMESLGIWATRPGKEYLGAMGGQATAAHEAATDTVRKEGIQLVETAALLEKNKKNAVETMSRLNAQLKGELSKKGMDPAVTNAIRTDLLNFAASKGKQGGGITKEALRERIATTMSAHLGISKDSARQYVDSNAGAIDDYSTSTLMTFGDAGTQAAISKTMNISKGLATAVDISQSEGTQAEFDTAQESLARVLRKQGVTESGFLPDAFSHGLRNDETAALTEFQKLSPSDQAAVSIASAARGGEGISKEEQDAANTKLDSLSPDVLKKALSTLDEIGKKGGPRGVQTLGRLGLALEASGAKGVAGMTDEFSAIAKGGGKTAVGAALGKRISIAAAAVAKGATVDDKGVHYASGTGAPKTDKEKALSKNLDDLGELAGVFAGFGGATTKFEDAVNTFSGAVSDRLEKATSKLVDKLGG